MSEAISIPQCRHSKLSTAPSPAISAKAEAFCLSEPQALPEGNTRKSQSQQASAGVVIFLLNRKGILYYSMITMAVCDTMTICVLVPFCLAIKSRNHDVTFPKWTSAARYRSAIKRTDSIQHFGSARSYDALGEKKHPAALDEKSLVTDRRTEEVMNSSL